MMAEKCKNKVAYGGNENEVAYTTQKLFYSKLILKGTAESTK